MAGSYPPSHHSEYSVEKLVRLIELLRLATLIAVRNDETSVSFIPMLVEHAGDKVALIGHLDAANPQAALLDGQRMQAVFHGPQSYISPDDYESSQLPTWNYAHVVATGKVDETPGDEVKRRLLARMAETFGGPAQEFSLDPADRKMSGMLGGIRAFRMSVDHLVGRVKLSQDKNPADARAVLNAMKLKSAAREAAAFHWIEEERMLP